MLDSYGTTSADALRLALPQVPIRDDDPYDISTVDASFSNSSQLRLEIQPSLRASKELERRKKVKSSTQRLHSKGAVACSDQINMDVSMTEAKMAGLSILTGNRRGDNGGEILANAGTPRRLDRIRKWFERCGCLD